MKSANLVCKCHGVSGSCLVRTCWRITTDFRVIGNYLKQKYSNAKHVDLYQTSNRIRQIRDIKWKTPRTNELIFLDSSPDYCLVTNQHGRFSTNFYLRKIRIFNNFYILGFYGTDGRICNKTSSGPDSCELMCCGRGYQKRRLTLRYSCRCTFYWCCRVKCQVSSSNKLPCLLIEYFYLI